jgi:hypothetical protein
MVIIYKKLRLCLWKYFRVMANLERDISAFFDPFIECSEALSVNVNKRPAYRLFIGALVFFLIPVSSSIYEGQLGAIIFASGATLLIAIICIVYYLRINPVLVIDKKGIILKRKFYSWESIDAVTYETASDSEGCDHMKFYLKEGKPVYFNLEPLLFLDQKPKVIAAYIIKYLNPPAQKARFNK